MASATEKAGGNRGAGSSEQQQGGQQNPSDHAGAMRSFAASLTPEQRSELAKALGDQPETRALVKPKPVKKEKFTVTATRLGYDGLSRRYPGEEFEMSINVNDDWPDWVVKSEDYVPPPKEELNRSQVRGGVTGHSVI